MAGESILDLTMQDFPLVKDFAIIMMTAGGIAFFSSRLRLSPMFGYLVAGMLIGPYTFANPPIENVAEVQLLADLGLVLLLFGIGLEFNWHSIRQIGLAVIFIAIAQILIMLYLGYWLGQLLGWDRWDSIFLGSALCLTSSAIAISTLKELHRTQRISSRLIVGISVAEDFAAVILIAILTGMARTGVDDLRLVESGYIVLKLVAFIAVAVGIGTLIIPRILKMISQTGSRDVLLVTSLGLCFGGALISRELMLSVATGAFLMGSMIGNTDQSEKISEGISGITCMFGALYFVAIGMLVDVSRWPDFLGPALIITCFFIGGKILCNMLLVFLAGFGPKTSLDVGLNMPHMGEFSLALAKIGKQYGVVRSTLYPSIAVAAALIALISPWLIRWDEAIAALIDHRSPPLLKGYVQRLSEWIQTLKAVAMFDEEGSCAIRRGIRTILANSLIVMAVIGIGSLSLPYVEDMKSLNTISDAVIGFVFGLGLLALCLPSFLAIWRAVRSIDDTVNAQLIGKRLPAGYSKCEPVRVIVRDSIFIVLMLFALIWSFPLISELFAIGSLAAATPLLLLAIMVWLTQRFVRQIHASLENTFQRTMLGGEEKDGNSSDCDGFE